MCNKNIRLDIEPHVVERTINEAIVKARAYQKDQIERLPVNAKQWNVENPEQWVKTKISETNEFVNERIGLQKTYYSTVRIIKRPIDEKPYILVYGDVDDETVTSGTGGFSSYEEAINWFVKQGR